MPRRKALAVQSLKAKFRRETRAALDQDQAGPETTRHSGLHVVTMGKNGRRQGHGYGSMSRFQMWLVAATHDAWAQPPRARRKPQEDKLFALLVAGERAFRRAQRKHGK